jgi:hypothetical protein
MLALGWAQVFGLTRGYVCDCSGTQEITPFDHCHSSEVFGCHHEDEPLHSHEDHEHEPTHEHALLKESLDLQLLSAPQSLISPMIITEMSGHDYARNDTLQLPAFLPAVAAEASLRRRWPQVLTRSIALQV